MIRTLRGKVTSKQPPQIIIEAAGVGYGIQVSLDTVDSLTFQDEGFLYIHHHITEGKQELYGFAKADERDFFELLLTISGVGPKSALSIIGSNSPDVLRAAIAQGQSEIFMSAAGVGKKTAERIILELKSKVGVQPDLSSNYSQVYEALRSLGYSTTEVKQALSTLPVGMDDVQEQIRYALRVLAK